MTPVPSNAAGRQINYGAVAKGHPASGHKRQQPDSAALAFVSISSMHYLQQLQWEQQSCLWAGHDLPSGPLQELITPHATLVAACRPHLMCTHVWQAAPLQAGALRLLNKPHRIQSHTLHEHRDGTSAGQNQPQLAAKDCQHLDKAGHLRLHAILPIKRGAHFSCELCAPFGHSKSLLRGWFEFQMDHLS